MWSASISKLLALPCTECQKYNKQLFEFWKIQMPNSIYFLVSKRKEQNLNKNWGNVYKEQYAHIFNVISDSRECAWSNIQFQ